MVKVITFFLIFIAILALLGRLRFPGQKRIQAMKCPTCGRYRIGKSGCGCG